MGNIDGNLFKSSVGLGPDRDIAHVGDMCHACQILHGMIVRR